MVMWCITFGRCEFSRMTCTLQKAFQITRVDHVLPFRAFFLHDPHKWLSPPIVTNRHPRFLRDPVPKRFA